MHIIRRCYFLVFIFKIFDCIIDFSLKELEIIEEQWRAESAELVSAISRLQEENKRLQKERCREGAEDQDSESANDAVANNCSEQLWRRMGETNEQQRATLREKEVLLEDKETIIEGVCYYFCNLSYQFFKLLNLHSLR